MTFTTDPQAEGPLPWLKRALVEGNTGVLRGLRTCGGLHISNMDVPGLAGVK